MFSEVFCQSCTLGFVPLFPKSVGHTVSEKYIPVYHSMPSADPEIFMRGGPTKMVIFGHRRVGKNPEITFF